MDECHHALTDLFGDDFASSRLDGGLRANTFRIKKGSTIVVVQFYHPPNVYQARKKRAIYHRVEAESTVPVPKIIDSGVVRGMGYLLMNEIPGQTLASIYALRKSYPDECLSSIGHILSQIHRLPESTAHFGWLTDTGVPASFPTFGDYLAGDVQRIETRLAGRIRGAVAENIHRRLMRAVELAAQKRRKPVLCWYDIHDLNIMVRPRQDTYEITGWLDPGASRIGAAEWDLAYTRFEFAAPNDARQITEAYRRDGGDIDDRLVEALVGFVAADLLSISLEEDLQDLAGKCLEHFRQEP